MADGEVDFVNMEILWNATTTGADALVLKYQAVWFPPEQIQVQDALDGLTLNVNGLLFGSVVKATSFSTGKQTDT